MRRWADLRQAKATGTYGRRYATDRCAMNVRLESIARDHRLKSGRERGVEVVSKERLVDAEKVVCV